MNAPPRPAPSAPPAADGSPSPRAAPPLEDEVLALLGDAGPVASALGEAYEPRPGQLHMAREVSLAFAREEVALLEAGTGIGKSFAYLTPAALHAARTRERVVVSTATIHLQEQLLQKDVPLLRQALAARGPEQGGPLPDLTAVVVKGRGNYVSLRRAEEASELGLEAFASPQEQADVQRLAEWARTTRTGDRGELSPPPSPEAWEWVESQGDNCLGQRCPRHGECHFFAARQAAQRAQLVVVNHSLLLSDVSLRLASGNQVSVLPSFARLVLDEGHHLEHTAGEQFGSSLSEFALSRALGRLQRRRDQARGLLPALVGRLLEVGPEATPLARQVEELLRPLRDRASEEVERAFAATAARLRAELPPLEREASETKLRLGPQSVPLLAPLTQTAQALALLAARILRWSDEAGARLEGRGRNGLESLLRELEAVARRLARSAQELGQLLAPTADDGLVRWAELTRRRNGREQLTLRAVPLDVGPLLRQALFQELRTVVVCSATLSVGGSFAFLRQHLGLDLPPDLCEPDGHPDGEPPAPPTPLRVREARIASPFDYARQAVLAIPADMPLPDAPGYEGALADAVWACTQASRGRAFVLFTSHAALTRAHARLAGEMFAAGMTPLRQGEESRRELLARFRREPQAVLFGTDAFWEGVDVAGEGLVLVIIARLPFRVPSEPLQAARTEAVAARGGDPFRELQLPQAVLKLTQGFGRLIRTQQDRGAVVVLDRRLTARSYGRAFLDSLPPVRIETPPLEELPGTVTPWVR